MKITGVRTRLYEYRTVRKLADANDPTGSDSGSGLATFIDTDEGVTGVMVGNPGARGTIHSLVNGLLVGQDPRGVRGLWKRMIDSAFKGGIRGPVASAISTIDIALWDLKAKIAGDPLWRMLGASVPKVKAYASGIDLCLTDDEIFAFYSGLADKGVHAGKLKIGLDMESDLRRLGLVKQALARSGKQPLLMIDSNEYWSPKQAIRAISQIEREFDLTWVEEPARRWDYRGLRQVSRAVKAAVATGENLREANEYMPLIDNEAVDVVQIGQNACGFTGLMQIADLAYGFELPVAMMNCPGNFLAHVAAALPNHMMMEVTEAGREVCFSTDQRIEDGYIVLGNTPGLGWTFDEEKVAALEIQAPGPGTRQGSWGRRRGAGLFIVPPDEQNDLHEPAP
jgi:L-alanine-DL-glutamate epimerase-like enolase superfamily enzyme